MKDRRWRDDDTIDIFYLKVGRGGRVVFPRESELPSLGSMTIDKENLEADSLLRKLEHAAKEEEL